MKQTSQKVNYLAYLSWLAVTSFYFYQYILRISPGVLIDQLRSAFAINAEQFATFGAFYLIGYSLLQVPLGILVDKVGVKKMVLSSIFICIVATWGFASAENFRQAQLCRLFIGVGSAPAFICALKVIADNFPKGTRGLLLGTSLSLGTIGPLVTSYFIVSGAQNHGWRYTFYLTALMGFVIMLINFLVIVDKKEAVIQKISLEELWIKIKEILSNKTIVYYSILAIGLYTPLSVLADLWGTAFLKQKYMLSQVDAANCTVMLYLGLAIGSIILPWLFEKYNMLNSAIFLCSIVILPIVMFLLHGPVLSYNNLVILFISLGFFCGAEMICFTGALQFSRADNSGTILGLVNTFNMLGGAVLQQIVGTILDYQWSRDLDHENIRKYSTDEFVTALSILTIVIAICCIVSFRLLWSSKNRP